VQFLPFFIIIVGLSRPHTSVPYGSPEWADATLRFAIADLRGKNGCKSRWQGRLQMALIMRKRLLDRGYVWHAERIDNWIHRVMQLSGTELTSERRGGDSLIHSVRDKEDRIC